MRHQQAAHREIRYSCDQCEDKATTKEALIEHKKRHHDNNIFDCNQCDYTAETKGDLKKHTELIHDKKNKYVTKRIQCQYCEKKFNKKETFKTHMKKFHNQTED